MDNIILTGVSGQAGSYFAEYLLANTKYDIYGMTRRLSVQNHQNIEHLKSNPRFHIFSGDLNDVHSISKSVEEIQPDYYINCAAQSFVAESWISPFNTMQADACAIIHQLEAIRKYKPSCRYLNFGSSEEFGDVIYSPQDEKHPARARSIYGAAKIAARQIVKVYRESYGLYAVQPWNFNYESKRRGIEFVTRKITNGVARIHWALGGGKEFEPISLGGFSSKRDWSHTEDIIEGVWRMLNQEIYNEELYQKANYNPYYICKNPTGAERHLTKLSNSQCLSKHIKEYVFSSGKTHEIREFVEKAFQAGEINGSWQFIDNLRKPENEIYVQDETGNILVKIDPKFYRPADVHLLLGDSSLAKRDLGWGQKWTFDDLIKEMVQNDIENYIAGIN